MPFVETSIHKWGNPTIKEVSKTQEFEKKKTFGIPEHVLSRAEIDPNDIVKITPLVQGMSGTGVAKMNIRGGKTLVAKWDGEESTKVRKEIRGQKALADTPLDSWLLPQHVADEEKGILITPFFEGEELRSGIRKGTIGSELAIATVSDLLNVKQKWWSEQQKRNAIDREYISMQREEWLDTEGGIHETIGKLSDKYHISPDDLMSKKIVYNGEEYPSIDTAMSTVRTILTKKPPYTVLAHNDATGGNILVTPEKKALIDGEWIGQSDPAEAYVRMTKYITSSTVTIPKEEDTKISLTHDGVIIVNFNALVPPTAIDLQNQGLSKLPEFSESLHDTHFRDRVFGYLAGSYLRELSLGRKRGLDKGIFAMIKAVDVASGLPETQKAVTTI